MVNDDDRILGSNVANSNVNLTSIVKPNYFLDTSSFSTFPGFPHSGIFSWNVPLLPKSSDRSFPSRPPPPPGVPQDGSKMCSPRDFGLMTANIVVEDGNNKSTLSKWHQNQLESFFSKNHYPAKDAVKDLSNWFGISENKLQIWFQNRRAKHRRINRTRKRPGRPSLAHPPTNCTGTPIPEEELSTRLKKRPRKGNGHPDHSGDTSIKSEQNEQNASRTTNSTAAKDDDNNDKVDSTSDRCTAKVKENPLPSDGGSCPTDVYSEDDDDYVDVCGSPPYHSTPNSGHKSRTLIDSGVESMSSSVLQQEIASNALLSSPSIESFNPLVPKSNSFPSKRLRFSIENILGLS